MAVQVVSVARPTRCWPYVARHIAHDTVILSSCAPPPFPFVLLCPRCRPLGVLLGSTRLLVGVLPGRVGRGGRPTLALVPPSGSFPTGGPMHALPVRV